MLLFSLGFFSGFIAFVSEDNKQLTYSVSHPTDSAERKVTMSVETYCGSYTLTHFNGRRTATEASLHFSRDGEALKVFINVANTLRGRVSFDDGRLNGMLMSTNMMGDEEQMAIEDGLASGFSTGFDVRRENDRVLLKNENNSYVFVKILCMEDICGDHAIISINGQAPAEDFTIKITPDGNGGSFVIANVANSIRGDCRVDGGVLQGEVATTNMETDPQMAAIEELISTGLKRGFHVSKNDTGVVLQSSNCQMQLYHIANCEEIVGEYLLKSYNGRKVNTSQQSTICFTTDPKTPNKVGIFICVANRIRGTAKLEQNVLKSDDPLLSTRMSGSEEENNLEAVYNAGFQYGLEVVYRNNELVLKDDDSEFVFTRVAEVQSVNGEPTYKGTYAGKCFKTQGNGLLFRIVDEHEGRWAFYNDTKDYRMHVYATFGSRSRIQALGNARFEENSEGRFVVEVTVEPQETEMFIEGDVNGYKIVYNAEPI